MIQFCSFSLSFCSKVSNWRYQTCLLPSSPLSYLHSKHGASPSVRQCHDLYKAFVAACVVFRDLIFKLSEFHCEMRVPEYSSFSSFLFHPINGQATVTFKSWEEKKKRKSKWVTLFCVWLSLICKKTFVQCISIYIKLNMKASNRILIRT